jgi:hypothetical protein
MEEHEVINAAPPSVVALRAAAIMIHAVDGYPFLQKPLPAQGRRQWQSYITNAGWATREKNPRVGRYSACYSAKICHFLKSQSGSWTTHPTP